MKIEMTSQGNGNSGNFHPRWRIAGRFGASLPRRAGEVNLHRVIPAAEKIDLRPHRHGRACPTRWRVLAPWYLNHLRSLGRILRTSRFNHSPASPPLPTHSPSAHRAALAPGRAPAAVPIPPPPGISITSRSPGGTTRSPFGPSSSPDFSDSRPRAPWPAAAAARAAETSPARNRRKSRTVRVPALPISITCPSPPRCRPMPPESVRSSLRQITSGVIASVASTGTLRTPEGNGVALKPVLLRPRAGAAGVKAHHHERRAGLAANAGQPVPRDQLQGPQIGRPLGRHPSGDRLIQTAINHIGQHVPHRRARVDRRGIFR
jgi:hypothetical protein